MRPIPPEPHRESGVALITVLLIVVLITSVTSSMVSDQYLSIQRTANILDHAQNRHFIHGIEDWAMQVLARDLADGKTDHNGEPWAVLLPPLAVEGGLVSGRLEDLQSKFNLNNLIKGKEVQTEELRRLRRLLSALDINENLADVILDWIDEDQDPRPDGAEDGLYTSLDTPYRSANRPFFSVTELLLLHGFDLETYLSLRPFVTALPEYTNVNINTADANIIYSLLPEPLTMTDADQIISDRSEEGYTNLEEFFSQPALKDRPMNQQGISLSTDYFLLHAQSQYNDSHLHTQTVIMRNQNGQVTTLSRTEGET